MENVVGLMAAAIVVLCLVIVVQQTFFMHQIQKLVDKAMSGTFQHYQNALKPREKVQLPVDPPDDLGVLQEFRV